MAFQEKSHRANLYKFLTVIVPSCFDYGCSSLCHHLFCDETAFSSRTTISSLRNSPKTRNHYSFFELPGAVDRFQACCQSSLTGGSSEMMFGSIKWLGADTANFLGELYR